MTSPCRALIERHWRARLSFHDASGWLSHLYNRALRRLPRLPLPGRQRITRVTLRKHSDPFFVRLGSTDMLVLEEIFQTGEYACVEGALQGVRTIVDLGANIGASLRYWHQVFPQAHMVAVEPDPDNMQLCRRNIEAARFSRLVTLVSGCVGAERKTVGLTGAEAWGYRMVQPGESGAVTAEVFPLEEILNNYVPGKDVDLLKCDIEGAERELFKHCRAWISRIKAIVVEIHPPYSPMEFLSDVERAGAGFELVQHFSQKACAVLFMRASIHPFHRL